MVWTTTIILKGRIVGAFVVIALEVSDMKCTVYSTTSV